MIPPVASTARGTRRWRLPQFLREVYAPGLHLAFAAAWALALEGALRFVQAEPGSAAWRPDARSLVAIATLFLVLFFLRVVDEWKDLDYDRLHKPERPLVRGLVTLQDLGRYLAGSALLVLALQLGVAWGSPWPLSIALLDMGWGLALVALERRWRRLREGMLLNLLLTYPVNMALSVYVYAVVLAGGAAAPSARGGLVLLAFALAFLVYELLRKTAWPAHARPGERLYSQLLGPGGAIAAVLGCALGAACLLGGLFLGQGLGLGWAVLVAGLPLLPVGHAAWRFWRERTQRLALAGAGMGYLLLFYGGLCLLWLARWVAVMATAPTAAP